MNEKLALALSGALSSMSLKRPGMPGISVVKTEGPLGDLLKSMVPSGPMDSGCSQCGSMSECGCSEPCGQCGSSTGCGCGKPCGCESECCCGEAMEILKKLAGKKYQLILGYIHYGDQLRAMFRDGIYEHFKTHVKEERAQVYEINKKVTALGGDAPCAPLPVPALPLDDARALFKSLIQMEEESVAMWSQLFHLTSETDVALNGMAQTYATECQAHIDDLKRYLRSCE